LGASDGLVSTFVLVAGVAGGGMSTNAILLAGITGGNAGAISLISMAAEECMATNSRGEIALETAHIRKYKADEMRELRDLLARIGIYFEDDHSLVRRVTTHYINDEEALLKPMVALEFGIIEDERRSPWKAFFLFVPFPCWPLAINCTICDCCPSSDGFDCGRNSDGNSLAARWGLESLGNKRKVVQSSFRELVRCRGGGVVAYGIGIGFEAITK